MDDIYSRDEHDIDQSGSLCLHDHANPCCQCNTSDRERASLLREFLDAISHVCPNPRLMPLGDGKNPIIEDKCRLDTDQSQSFLVDGEDAVDRMRAEGARGFLIYAGKPNHGTERLVFADRDEPERWPSMDETLTVISGSGRGDHLTYVNGGSVRNAHGKGDLQGAGSIHAHNLPVVVPGSIHPSGGIYHAESVAKVDDLHPQDLPDELLPTTSSDTHPITDDVEWEEIEHWGELDPTVRERVQRAEGFAFGDQFAALKRGHYSEAGFTDRSDAEFRLVEILGWLFQDDEETVANVMKAICRLNPQTNYGTRKWLERDSRYRELTVKNGCKHDTTYDPPAPKTPGFRPPVSHITASNVYEAVFDLGFASSQEITDHPAVDRGKRQVQRALDRYCEEGLVNFVRDGREVRYYIGKEFVPQVEREEYGL